MTSDRKSETAMKALKPIIASLTLLFAVPVCIAGNPFVPSEKGTALTYVNRDRKEISSAVPSKPLPTSPKRRKAR